MYRIELTTESNKEIYIKLNNNKSASMGKYEAMKEELLKNPIHKGLKVIEIALQRVAPSRIVCVKCLPLAV